MAEQPGREHRNGDEGVIASRAEHRVVGERQLRDVELLVAQHPVEGLARPRDNRVQFDPLRPDASVDQRTDPVVIPERYRQADIGHGPNISTESTGWRSGLPTSARMRNVALQVASCLESRDSRTRTGQTKSRS